MHSSHAGAVSGFAWPCSLEQCLCQLQECGARRNRALGTEQPAPVPPATDSPVRGHAQLMLHCEKGKSSIYFCDFKSVLSRLTSS